MISLIRMVGWLAVLTIVALSVVPGQMRPDVLGEKHVEHVVAYFGAAMLLAIGYPRRSQLVLIGTLLPACAGMLEIIQLGINGRTASITDFATSVLGAWIGVMVGCFFGMTRRTPIP
jgi:VanZ family protein